VAIYVDDVLVFAKLIKTVASFKRELANIFPVLDLGEACWILNMEIICD
jgi:hypothetical protein